MTFLGLPAATTAGAFVPSVLFVAPAANGTDATDTTDAAAFVHVGKDTSNQLEDPYDSEVV